jgi:hypothetical protein
MRGYGWHCITGLVSLSALWPSTYVEPSKDEMFLFCIRPQGVPRSKRSSSRLYKNSLLISYKGKVAVCSETHKEHTKQCEHNVEFLDVKPGGKQSNR